jgi:hypothetical protein
MTQSTAWQHMEAHYINKVSRAEFQVSERDKTIKELKLKLLLAGVVGDGPKIPTDSVVAHELERTETSKFAGLQIKSTAISQVCGLLLQMGYSDTVMVFQKINRNN